MIALKAGVNSKEFPQESDTESLHLFWQQEVQQGSYLSVSFLFDPCPGLKDQNLEGKIHHDLPLPRALSSLLMVGSLHFSLRIALDCSVSPEEACVESDPTALSLRFFTSSFSS